MKTIHVICEGQTEANFVNKVLNVHFCTLGKYLNPVIVVTKADSRKGKLFKGGMQNFSTAENIMKKYFPLLSKTDTFVTTMFDFYALPSDAPGYEKIEKLTDAYDKISCLENALHEKYPNPKFIPYFQLHEFEALVFSNLDKLGELYFEHDISELHDCLSEISNPELINTRRETAPSKRILKCIPYYDKVTLGVQVLEETDFTQIRKNCHHFDEWISKLEQL